jgi:hypothetical protein
VDGIDAKIEDLLGMYEVIDHRHALSILRANYHSELEELLDALLAFRLTDEMLLAPGGNESQIPKAFSAALRRHGWQETRITGELLVSLRAKRVATAGYDERSFSIPRFIDGHQIDYVKGAVAFDLEWNAKDQTFDRDLFAFRTFYEANVIAAGVLVTRAEDLNQEFRRLGIMAKYGAATTWLGKLRERLRAGRGGGCPVLALGITRSLLERSHD